VIVCASRFWHNYRHAANALSVYTEVRRQAARDFRPRAVALPQCVELGLDRGASALPARLGVPDSRVVLMLADDWAGDARNPFPGTVFGSALRTRNLFLDDIQARPRRWYTVAGASTSRQQCTECDAQQVDYSGQDVTVANFLSVLTGGVCLSVARPPMQDMDHTWLDRACRPCGAAADQHPSEHTPASRRLRSTPADHVLVSSLI
jgi:phosphatidylinositol glycan class K